MRQQAAMQHQRINNNNNSNNNSNNKKTNPTSKKKEAPVWKAPLHFCKTTHNLQDPKNSRMAPFLSRSPL